MTSEGCFTLLPGYVSRPQPSPAKPAPPARIPSPLEGGFVPAALQFSSQEACPAHSCLDLTCSGYQSC